MTDSEQYIARMQRLVDLVNRPGWQDFAEFVMGQARSVMSSPAGLDTPHKMAMAVGAYNALTNILEWPAREVKATQQFLNDIT